MTETDILNIRSLVEISITVSKIPVDRLFVMVGIDRDESITSMRPVPNHLIVRCFDGTKHLDSIGLFPLVPIDEVVDRK